MRVRDVMTPNVERIPPDCSLSEAARIMKECQVGALPVYEGDKLVGMLTDRDIVVRALAEDRDPANCRARDVMTPGILYCYDDEDVTAAAKSMREKQVRRLPVVSREKRLVGIVSLGDVAVTANEKVAGTALRGVSEERGQPAPARSH